MRKRIVAFSAMALIGFAGNNVCAWLAAADTTTDPATYTIIRLLGGAIGAFGMWAWLESKTTRIRFDPWAGLALVIYAIPFAYAYTGLGGGVGSTILFVVAQAVIVLVGYAYGSERPTARQWLSLAIAIAGFLAMILSKWFSNGAVLMDGVMVCSGAAWGWYVVQGRSPASKNAPIATTVGSFTIATLLACICWPFLTGETFLNLGNELDLRGGLYALLSGVLFSGVAYSVWYLVVKEVKYIIAGAIQLATPFFVTVLLLPRVSPSTWQLASGIAALMGMAAYVYLEHLKRKADDLARSELT